MTATYGRVVRRSVVITTAAAVVMVGICAGLGGAKGVYGSLIGVGIVTVFFGISVLVVGRAAKVSPQVMMTAALGSYIIKIVAFMVVMALLGRSTAVFNGKMLGFTALVCILVWCGAQVVNTIKLKMLYVDPDGGPQ
jgi:ATP synthase protein I